MTPVELLALLKTLVYVAPLVLLLRATAWKWLSLAIIVLMVTNAVTAAGASREATQVIGFVFQALIIGHALELSKYERA